MNRSAEDLVSWFRQSAPYINAHRGKTFVVMLSGEASTSANFNNIIQDIALLKTLGVKIVLVCGARPQIDSLIEEHHHSCMFAGEQRITDERSLNIIKQAVGQIQMDIEAQLSMGLVNSPLHQAHINVVRGNFVVAQPIGIEDGIDFLHTGKVRRINHQSIKRQLDHGEIVMVSPLGVSVTGELFNICSEDITTEIAVSLKADKVIYFSPEQGIHNDKGLLISELLPDAANELMRSEPFLRDTDKDTLRYLRAAIQCSDRGIDRCHLVSYQQDGALLKELYTRDGSGTQLVQYSYERVREARLDDINGIIELIRPLEEEGILVRRSRELLEMEIERFTIVERDGMIIGCAALYAFNNENVGELACLVSHPQYRQASRGDRLLQAIVNRARQQGLAKLFVLTTKSIHWFRERGFSPADFEDLPTEKQAIYNLQRRSKILIMDVER
ncbi:amino-acid N-acetyltransferase [Agarivorans sp. Toyoura001]|uniref:amino-acid N-acetyltransferase n=1 Tax=unclassified Agarivorans TaxID=2636026 RepID=UPI0010EB7590|nr:amino-acid N-acetyltransferase [Agarivorans sp. Toyoura001]GDY25216.1 amino-acid acetyltransferase [Agarivorans sp. Toyoura001]